MKRNVIVLEKWRKNGYTNRLVTDGKRIWLEYLSKSNMFNSYQREWKADSTEFAYHWLKVFK